MALCMDNMQSLSLLDIMSKSYKKGMNEMDSAVIGIVEMSYNSMKQAVMHISMMCFVNLI